MDIHKSTADRKDELVELRRALHRIPEESFAEFETSAFIKEYLTALRPDKLCTLAKTGVKAVFDVGAKKTVAIRADIDALPVEEKTGLPFASVHPGFMHACGHDGHMAAALAAARIVSEKRGELKTNFVFLFQPAEETIGGAKPMINEGALEEPHVDEIYGVHVWPSVPKGKIGLKDGPMMANMCDMNIRIVGRQAHGAAPYEGRDALNAAAHFITAANSIVSRNIDPFDTAVLNIGRMTAGDARNIVCREALIEGTIRSFDDRTAESIKKRILQIMAGMDAAFGTRSEYFETMGYPALYNNGELYARAKKLFTPGEWFDTPAVMMSEDFAYYTKETKGLFAFIGTGGVPLHSDTFDFDEKILLSALEFYVRICGIE